MDALDALIFLGVAWVIVLALIGLGVMLDQKH
jgi:hypothetical protein